MSMNLLELLNGLIQGFFLAISPCVISVLPIILTGSLNTGKYRPIGIVLGLIFTFILASLVLNSLLQEIGISKQYMKFGAAMVIILFALTMLIPFLRAKFELFTSNIAQWGDSLYRKFTSTSTNNQEETESQFPGLISGFVLGGCLGLIWTPCAGPLLGSILIQAAVKESLVQNLSLMLVFCLGFALPVLIIAFLSNHFSSQVNFFKQNSHHFQKVAGLVILLSVFYFHSSSFVYIGQILQESIVSYSFNTNQIILLGATMPTVPNLCIL